MADNRTIKEMLVSLEIQATYTNNHLSNIDNHLNKLNERTGKNEISSAKNSNNIKWITTIGSTVITAIGIALAFIFKRMGGF